MEILKAIFECMWNIVSNYISPLGDFCIVIITLVVFVFTYISKKVTILSVGESHSIWEGYSISLVLKNCTLADICVKNLSLIFDDKMEFTVNKYDIPVIIGALKTMTFESEKMSQNPFEEGFTLYRHKIRAKITLADNKIVFAKMKTAKFRKHKNEKVYETPFFINYTDGDSVITEHMKYKAVIYKNDTFVTDIIILNNGLMNQAIAGYNAIPPESLRDTSTVKAAIESLLKSKDFTVVVLDYSIKSFHSRG